MHRNNQLNSQLALLGAAKPLPGQCVGVGASGPGPRGHRGLSPSLRSPSSGEHPEVLAQGHCSVVKLEL